MLDNSSRGGEILNELLRVAEVYRRVLDVKLRKIFDI